LHNYIHISIPLLDELDNIDSLLSNFQKQTYKSFTIYLCINQPNSWWDDPNKSNICKRNLESIEYIESRKKEFNFSIQLIDRASKGNGWNDKKHGVGWARKTLMDKISNIADPNDIIISLDADTRFDIDYFEKIDSYFKKNTHIDCLSLPYYHPLNENDNANRAILRYEIYMRFYLLNLLQINSPYAFTALGSAIAFKVSALKKIGGFSPKKSGEDFYFLQKMVKYKGVGIWADTKLYPEARFSDRVFFGTGPAMIKGDNGDWSSYPIYSKELFNRIFKFYQLIPKLYIENIETPIDNFWNDNEKKIELFNKLRNNNKDEKHFIKAVHDYFDGLRILQYLKQNNKGDNDISNLIDFLKQHPNTEILDILSNNFSFENSSISQLNQIRDYLCKLEDIKRQEIFYNTWKTN